VELAYITFKGLHAIASLVITKIVSLQSHTALVDGLIFKFLGLVPGKPERYASRVDLAHLNTVFKKCTG
jgi:hypothetical protein